MIEDSAEQIPYSERFDWLPAYAFYTSLHCIFDKNFRLNYLYILANCFNDIAFYNGNSLYFIIMFYII